MRSDVLAGLRTIHHSPVLYVGAAPSEEIPPTVAGIRDQMGAANTRYYLSAGTARFDRPPWGFGPRPARAEPPTVDRSLVDSIVSCREERDAAVTRETRAVQSWFGTDDGTPRCLVVEALGPPGVEDVAFWQACRMSIGTAPGNALPPMVVLRHDAPAPFEDGEVRGGGQADEILLALLLSGGYAWAAEFESCSALRGWDQAAIAAVTSTRNSEHGMLYTYAGLRERSRATVAYAAADRLLVADIAAMVVSVQPEPPIATAALVADPAVALRAFSRSGCAAAANRWRDLASYGRNLFRSGWSQRWTTIAKSTAATLYLAGIVADRTRITPAVAATVLNLAQRFEVDADIRSLLAYDLGQTLAKDRSPQSWAAGIRCFEYSRTCLLAKEAVDQEAVDPEADGSRMAASYNGTALACYRAGDRAGAVAAALAGLDALATPGVLEHGHLYEQQILLLANLAKVYGTGSEALACHRRAWHIAVDSGSLAGMAYVAGNLVRILVGAGGRPEAEAVTTQLLRHYDAAGDRSRNVERAVAAACWTLADANLTEGRVEVAADWYAAAVQRIHRPVPDVINGIIDNLHRQPEGAPASVAVLLAEALAAHTAMATDIRAVADLLGEREELPDKAAESPVREVTGWSANPDRTLIAFQESGDRARIACWRIDPSGRVVEPTPSWTLADDRPARWGILGWSGRNLLALWRRGDDGNELRIADVTGAGSVRHNVVGRPVACAVTRSGRTEILVAISNGDKAMLCMHDPNSSSYLPIDGAAGFAGVGAWDADGGLLAVNLDAGVQLYRYDERGYTAVDVSWPRGVRPARATGLRHDFVGMSGIDDSGKPVPGLLDMSRGAVHWFGAHAGYSCTEVAPSGAHVLTATWNGEEFSYRIVDTAGNPVGEVHPDSGTATDLSLSGDEQHVIGWYQDPVTAPTVMRWNVRSGEAQPVDRRAGRHAPGDARWALRWIADAGDRKLPEWVFEPGGSRHGGTVLFLHGGPRGRLDQIYDPVIAALVGAGWTVVGMNYPGSSGYGARYRDCTRGDWGGADAASIGRRARQLHAELGDRPMCLYGHSYGGYLALLVAATAPELFHRVAAWAPITDVQRLLYSAVGTQRRWLEEELGDLRFDAQRLWDRSPVGRLPGLLRTSLLVGHGRQDPKCPVEQSRRLVGLLGGQSGTVRYIEDADGSHAPVSWRRWTDAVLAHFEPDYSPVPVPARGGFHEPIGSGARR